MLNIGEIIGKFVKNSSQRELERLGLVVQKINNWEHEVKEMPDENFPTKTNELKTRLKSGEKLEDLLPEAFAYVREAA